jgi:serine O-acetyltransferase
MGMQVQAGPWEPQDAGAIAASDSRTGIVSSGKEHAPLPLSRLIYLDYRRYFAAGARNALSVIAFTQGFWASTIFRVSHWALARCRIPGLRVVVKATCIILQKFIEIIAGICIPAGCNIGQGLYIGHFGGIFIDSEARIGENCNIAQGVTIGKGGRGELHGVPVLGDRVHIGANAVILGKITIGNDAVIGPGAVVMNSVPSCGVAMGNPARVVGNSGSFEFVNYDGMENDSARKKVLENRQPASQPGGQPGDSSRRVHGSSNADIPVGERGADIPATPPTGMSALQGTQ